MGVLNSWLCVVSACGGTLKEVEKSEGVGVYECSKCGVVVKGEEAEKLQRELGLADQFFKRGRDMLLVSPTSASASWGKEADALRCFQQALKMRRAKLSPYHKAIAETEDAIAEVFCRLNDFASASKHCAASIEILTKFFDENSMVPILPFPFFFSS